MRIGVDLGGTKTEVALMDPDGGIRARKRNPTPQQEGYEAILENVRSLVLDVEGEAGAPCRVGVGTPGALSPSTGLLKNSNTLCLNGKPLGVDLERILGRPVRIANDANCFALAEAIDGAGRGYPVVFGVILGTGVGAGIVLNGRVHEGPQRIAGEWGHNVLEASGPRCYCGKRGCVETLISGPGLARDAGASDASAVVRAAEVGEERAEQALRRYFDRFGRALATVINILDPDAIVLGGGLSHVARLYTEGRDRVALYVFNDELRTPLLQNHHGDSSGVRGAAELWGPDE